MNKNIIIDHNVWMKYLIFGKFLYLLHFTLQKCIEMFLGDGRIQSLTRHTRGICWTWNT